jgi:hypothetical protein
MYTTDGFGNMTVQRIFQPLFAFVYCHSRQASPTTYVQEAFAYRYVGYIFYE